MHEPRPPAADSAAPPHDQPDAPPPTGFAALLAEVDRYTFGPAPDAQDAEALAAESRARRLHRVRHSAAHVMAEAVLQLFPDAKVATGPAIEHGFYYDFDLPRPLTPDDLRDIEKRMKKLIKRAPRFGMTEVPLGEARALFADHGQDYKVEVVDKIATEHNPETVTLYRQGKFVDLCAGPHVDSGKKLRYFKLLRTSGAYWRGDSDRPMLQRIYGTAWETREDLDAYLHFLEEAKKRNHKRLGEQLDLFRFDPLAPGAPFWTPRGFTTYQEFMAYWRKSMRRRGYQEIFNPLLYKKDLYEKSGHYTHYKDDMFILEADDTEYCLKPMNCPDTFLFYTSRRRSFRELPLRVSEGGILHRNELSGALNGLFRVRQFIQDDAHIFVTEEQVEDEIGELIEIVREVYELFDLQYRFSLSTRPEKFMGAPELWDEAEAGLQRALDRFIGAGAYRVNDGDGAFYGPKIDIEVTDCLGRKWQCATIQLDFQQPLNFDMKYAASDNTIKRPIVIHRAIFGSFERFFGILLEHTGGALPTWLSPVQAMVIPISDKALDYAREVQRKLLAADIRAEVDTRNEKMGYKVREAELRKTPWMLVVGEREAEEGTAALRTYKDGRRGAQKVDEVVAQIREAIANKTFDVAITPLNTFESEDDGIEAEKEY
jgi:threonyl-tRNA synthetase